MVRASRIGICRLQGLLAWASRAGGTKALLVDLDNEQNVLNVRLRLYGVTTRIVDGRGRSEPLAALADPEAAVPVLTLDEYCAPLQSAEPTWPSHARA